MSQIDWSRQPKEFPLWLEGIGTHRRHSGWYRRSGEVFEHENEGQFRSVREGQFFTIHERPAQPAWVGVGPPPVGMACEFIKHNSPPAPKGRWETGKVLYLSDCTIVIGVDGGERVHHPRNCSYRPIRTPEQIAAEERERGIVEMCELFMRNKGDVIRVVDCCERLYDAGCRIPGKGSKA